MRGLPHWTSARDENEGDDDWSAALDGPGSPPRSRLAVSARRMQRGPRAVHRVIAHHLRRGTARRAAAGASLTAQAGLEERQYQRQRLEAIRRSGAAPPPLRPTEAALHFPSWRRRRSSQSSGGGEGYAAGDSNPPMFKTRLTSFFRSSPHGASAGRRTGGGAFARHASRRPSASALRLPHLGSSTSPLLSHVLDWRVPSLTAEQELLQHAFAAAYSDACYRCLISQDAAKFFGPNEALQLVVDRWRADAFAQSQQALQQVVEQYHHDLLQVVTAVIDAEDAALPLLRGEAAASEENSSTSLLMHDVGPGAAGAAPASMLGSNPSDASFLKTVLHAGLASVPASIDCPAVSAAALHYATPALGRVLVYEGFFLCFWYSSTGERLGQLECRACRWVLEAHVPQVHVPLCFHFRYKGRGVTAMSLVPVGENLTTVTEQNPEVAALAQQLASVLSLLPYGPPLDRAHERASAATAAAAATSLGAARGRSSSAAASVSASFAATGADGEAMPDTCFLPRSVRAHFAQDGRYYFLRNHQWFAPWLNSRQSFDAASQRLCYLNPRLLAACGVQVSCRACQRDASLEESRLALEFMRREVDAGIPQLLHSERELQMRQTLRRRERAAALHFRVRRALRAAEEVEARRQTTQVWMGAAEGAALATNSRLAVAEGDDAESPPGSERGDYEERTRDAGSDAEWEAASTGSSGGGGASDETSSSEDDGDGAAGGGAAAGLRGGRAHLPFATKSVVARFSARGYPKGFLGLLLLALLQYPAAPQSMLREVKRELLFRGLKAFILIRVYDARFGVEQLLARLPYERSADSEALWDGADAAGTSESDDEYEPVYHEDPGTPRVVDADAAAVPPSGRRTTTGSSSSPHRAPESPVVPIHATATSDGRTSTWLGSARPAAEAPLTPPVAAQTNPLLPALPVMLTPASSRNAEVTAADEAAGEHRRASQTFAQRWRESGGGDGGVGDGGGEASGDIGEVRQEAGFDPPSPRPASSSPTAAAAAEMHGRGWWVRVRARLVSMRVLWSGADTATSSSSSVANQSDASQPAVPNALQPHAGHADPAAGAQTGAAAAPPRRLYFGRGGGARGPQPSTERRSSLSSTLQGSPATGAAAPAGGSGSGAGAAAATATTTSWADFATATERVLAAFMQYDGTSHPAEAFCDSPRRLRAVQVRETGSPSTPSNSNSQSATAGGGGGDFGQRQPQPQHQQPPQQRRGSSSSGGALFVEEELWSSADALNRLYTEHILPFIYRKFRLSVRRTRVLYEPLSEEDRAAVYVRVLAALGARVVDGEVRQVVPVVRDFTPLRSSTAATASAAAPPQPASRHGGVPVPDAVNHVNPLEGPPPSSSAAPVTPPLGCLRRSPSPGAAQLTSPLSIRTNDGESGTSGASGGRTAARPGGFMAPGAHSEPESPTSGQGRASVLAPVHAVVSPSDVAAAIARAVELPTLTQTSAACYVLPRWVAWRARALVRRFLTDDVPGAGYGRDAVALRAGRRALRSPSTAATAGWDVPPALASGAAAQAAGLVPLLNLLYRVPDSALAAGVRRPDLPGWPETAARLLAHLRAASTAPHLVWDALELYELAEINAQPWDGRLEGPSWSAAPASAPHLSARRSSALRARDGPRGAGLGAGAPEGGSLDAAVADARAPATPPPPLLLPPESSLALALLYRRQTLRTPSDRAALIRVLQRRATAIGENASLALSPAGPKRETDATAAAAGAGGAGAGASAAGQAEKGADASRSGGGERRRELPDVAAAVIPLLQEVLLNADHLLEHLGNPYGAQYRQHTVDLVRYLELTAQAVRPMSSQSATGSEQGQRSPTAAQVQAEEEAVLQHLWKHLATYCKPDFMAAKDALQRAVLLYRQHEGVASGTFTPLDSLTAGRRSSGGGGGGGAVAAAAASTSWASAPSLELERDAAVEDALQRACELFAIADGPGSPLALRALSNQALYWFTVGCFPKWRECVQLLRRRWRDGGPDDVRLLLLATLTANTFGPGGGGAASLNSSSFRAGTSMLEVHPAAAARSGSVAARMTASLQDSESDLGSVAAAPICFLHRVKRE